MATKPRRAHRLREARFTETRGRLVQSEVMTVEQVAEYLQLNKLTIYKYVREGRLPAAKLGKAYRIRKSDVDLFLERQITHPARQAVGRQSGTAPRPRPEKEVVVPTYRRQPLVAQDRNPTDNLLDWMLRELH